MAETYCGKSCAGCTQKAALNCPGCKVGPGRQFSGDCELARCTRTKGHETCETCGLRGNCGNYRNRQFFPEYRRRAQEAERRKQEALLSRATLFGKWIRLLFWLVIPASLASLMSNDTVKLIFPGVYTVGQILNTLSRVAYGLILLKLGAEEDGYRKAGIYCTIASVLTAAMTVFSASSQSAGWTLFITVPAGIVGMIAEYHEYSTHSAVLADLDSELSEKWTLLWKWYIGLMLGMFGSLFLMLLGPTLGVLCLLAAAIGSLVVYILKLVYLYRTAKVFREFPVAQEETI